MRREVIVKIPVIISATFQASDDEFDLIEDELEKDDVFQGVIECMKDAVCSDKINELEDPSFDIWNEVIITSTGTYITSGELNYHEASRYESGDSELSYLEPEDEQIKTVFSIGERDYPATVNVLYQADVDYEFN